MAEKRDNTNGYSSGSTDTERDMGAKGGPTTTLGNPDAKHKVPTPYTDDIQTQLAAKSTDNNKDSKKDANT